jgi:acyl carrier protein phosphodiesterase
MNWLAHVSLADRTPASMAGNLAADWIKGIACLAALPPAVAEGVLMHRRLDAFTDTHPAVARARSRFPPEWRRVSGIVLDVYFDHLLSHAWPSFHGQPLDAFLDEAHGLLAAGAALLPEPAAGRVHRIVRQRTMATYASPESVGIALSRIAERFRRGPRQIADAAAAAHAMRDDLMADFAEFYPEVQREAALLRAGAAR